MTKRHLTAAATLATALTLSACGSNDLDTGTTAPAGAHGGTSSQPAPSGAHGGASSQPAAPAPLGNDADISFLTGMKPHHEQAVEMSDMVLAAGPPAPVAELARQVKAAQAPEIEQMTKMLTDLGQPGASGAQGGGHSAGHGGMMSEGDMAALRTAKGAAAARLYLEGMIAHHEGAIEAAETELGDGKYEPARQLATSIAQDQAAEITKMEGLLSSL